MLGCTCVDGVFFIMTGYRVWYRHDGEPDIDRIPTVPDIKPLTLQQLREATQGLHITHMCIRGDIPPNLESIAADIRQLIVRDLGDGHQLTR